MLREFLARWRRQRRCDHHWHPIGMVDWRCCWCAKYDDGWPGDQTGGCNCICRPNHRPNDPLCPVVALWAPGEERAP